MKSINYIFILLLVFSSCDERSLTDQTIKINKDLVEPAEEAVIGSELADEIVDKSIFEILDREDFQSTYNYLDQMFATAFTNQFVENRPYFNWNISIVQDDLGTDVFSLPGGNLFIESGLLKSLQSENELFSIIVHEIFYSDSQFLITHLIEEFGGLVAGDLLLGKQPSIPKTDLIKYFTEFTIDPDIVQNADDHFINVICQYNYHPSGLESIIQRAMESESAIHWLERRPNANNRIAYLQSNTDCNVFGEIFTQRYSQFVATLP